MDRLTIVGHFPLLRKCFRYLFVQTFQSCMFWAHSRAWASALWMRTPLFRAAPWFLRPEPRRPRSRREQQPCPGHCREEVSAAQGRNGHLAPISIHGIFPPNLRFVRERLITQLESTTSTLLSGTEGIRFRQDETPHCPGQCAGGTAQYFFELWQASPASCPHR